MECNTNDFTSLIQIAERILARMKSEEHSRNEFTESTKLSDIIHQLKKMVKRSRKYA